MVKPLRMTLPEDGQTVFPDISQKSNGPDKQESLFLIGQLDAMEVKKAALRKEEKALHRHINNRGGTVKSIRKAIAIRDEDDDTELRHLKEVKRYLGYMNVPLARHIRLFDEPHFEDEAVTAPDIGDEAYDDGSIRGLGGKPVDEQKWHPNTPEGMRHTEGWTDGQEILKQKFVAMNEEMAAQEASAARAKADKEADKAKKLQEKAAKAGRSVDPEAAAEQESDPA